MVYYIISITKEGNNGGNEEQKDTRHRKQIAQMLFDTDIFDKSSFNEM